MFERYTPRAREVVVYASHEARSLRHERIGTEHLLLGLLREGAGIGARSLVARGIEIEALRRRIEETIGRGPESLRTGQMPLTEPARRALEVAGEEAAALDHPLVGTEHVLLGVLADPDAMAAQLVAEFGTTAAELRADVLRAFSGEEPGAS